MKKNLIHLTTAAVLLTVLTGSVFAGSGILGVGAKYHAQHSFYTELPYADGDISASIAYSMLEADSFWQIALDYSFDVTGNDTTEYILTPQLNLLWTDGPWFGGLGILKSYIDDEITGTDWTGIYWQFILGFKVPLAGYSIDLAAFYPFKKWGDLGEFKFSDLNYGALLNFRF